MKACKLLKRRSIAEFLMETFPKFSKQLSNIVSSSTLVALQPADGESATLVIWKFFECSRVGELLLLSNVLE